MPESFRPAAVLLPFWPEGDAVHLLLIERSRSLPSHGGQVAFPGGRVEPDDASAAATALREAQEEVGLAPDSITLCTELDESWSGAGHRVRAFVGWLEEAPTLHPQTEEVASIRIADVEPLFVQAAPRRTCIQLRGEVYEQYHFDGPWGHVWGLSAELLVELFQCLGGQPDDWAAKRLDALKRYLASHPDRGPT